VLLVPLASLLVLWHFAILSLQVVAAGVCFGLAANMAVVEFYFFFVVFRKIYMSFSVGVVKDFNLDNLKAGL
jgi:hypothetical protein